METKRFALFLRSLAETIRNDVHTRKAESGALLEAYAEELDPTKASAPEPEPEAPAVVEPVAEVAPPAPVAKHGKDDHHKRR